MASKKMLSRISSQLFCRMQGPPRAGSVKARRGVFSLVSTVCEGSGHCRTQSYQRTCFEIPQTWERGSGIAIETEIGIENAISSGSET